MNEKQTEAFPLKAAYVFVGAHDLGDEVDEIRHMKIKWDRPYTKTSLRRGFITALFEKHRIFDLFKEEHWAFGNTPDGESRRGRLDEWARARYALAQAPSGAGTG